MSKKIQHPLPTIGSQNWGSTLNNYLRGQAYSNQEIQQEIEDIYAQQSNVAQTVLSSGVLSDTVDSKCPGLYSKSGQFVADGELLTFSSTSKYYYRGNAVVFGNSIISELIGGDDGLEIVAPTSTTLSTIDARCVYAYYDISSKAWVLKFGTTSDPSTESSISLDPYYICLGVLIKIGGNYYWHYKTMKANLSISSKKWMLDEPHATLSTYMTYNSTDKKIGVYFSETLDGTLSIQALGINPFTSTETSTNDLTSDLKTFLLAKKGTTASYSYYILRVDEPPTGSSYALESEGVVSNDGTSVYRLCATSVTIGGKALLLWQKATSSLDIDRSIFNNTDFSRLWYYCDPVELYRVKGSTMKATAGSGLSPINANGIDPHVTTLIKNSDDVWFGENESKKFHFSTQALEYPSDYNIIVPTTSDKNTYTSGTILTNTMTPFDGNIAISTKNAISNRGIILQAGANGSLFSSINKKYQLLLKSYEDASHYSYRDLADASTLGHQIEMVVEDGQKHPSILLRGDGYLKIETVDNNKADTTKSKIELAAASNPYMALTSPELLVNYSGSSTDFIKINPKDSKCIFTKDGDTSVKKSVTFDLSGDSPEIVVGGDAKLSSDGLYLPSGSSGIKIDSITGTCENKTGSFKCSTNTTYAYKTQVAAVWPGKVIYYPTEYMPLSYYDALGIQGNKLYKLTDTHWKEISGASGTFFTLTLPENNSQYICLLTSSHPNNSSEKCPLDFYCVALIDTQAADAGVEQEYNLYYETNQKTSLLQLGTLSSSASGIRTLGADAQLSIMNFNKDAILSCVHNVNGKIRMHCNAGEVNIGTNGGTLKIGNNAGPIIIKGDYNKGTITIDNSKSITITNSVIDTFNKKIGTRVAYNKNLTVEDSVLEFYESFMSMIPESVTHSITLYKPYYRLRYPSVNATWFDMDNTKIADKSSLDGDFARPLCSVVSLDASTQQSKEYYMAAPNHHQWIKVNIRAGNSEKTDGWCTWNVWALTGVQNRYRWLTLDEFYFQTGDEGSSSCKYFELDYRCGDVPTGSSYTAPLPGFVRNNWYTASPTGHMRLTAHVYIESGIDSSLSPSLEDSNNLSSSLKNDILALKYGIDADLGDYPVLWHLIETSNGGAVGRYKVYLAWGTTLNTTNKVHAPYAYHIQSRS